MHPSLQLYGLAASADATGEVETTRRTEPQNPIERQTRRRHQPNESPHIASCERHGEKTQPTVRSVVGAESAARLMLARMSDAATTIVAAALGGALAERRLAERARQLSLNPSLATGGTTTEWVAMDLLGVETDAELVGCYSSSIATSAMRWRSPWPSVASPPYESSLDPPPGHGPRHTDAGP